MGVAGDAEDAGDVIFEAHDMGVSGISNGVCTTYRRGSTSCRCHHRWLGRSGVFLAETGWGLHFELGGATVDEQEGEDVCTFFV